MGACCSASAPGDWGSTRRCSAATRCRRRSASPASASSWSSWTRCSWARAPRGRASTSRPSTRAARPGRVQQPRVPFVVAANAPRSIALAAEFGQGWITTGAPTEDLEEWWAAVAERADRFGEALAARGRPPESVARYLLLDAAPVFSLSSIAAFTEAIERAAALGFTDVITHWPRPGQLVRGRRGDPRRGARRDGTPSSRVAASGITRSCAEDLGGRSPWRRRSGWRRRPSRARRSTRRGSRGTRPYPFTVYSPGDMSSDGSEVAQSFVAPAGATTLTKVAAVLSAGAPGQNARAVALVGRRHRSRGLAPDHEHRHPVGHRTARVPGHLAGLRRVGRTRSSSASPTRR